MCFRFTNTYRRTTFALAVATCTGFLCMLPAVAEEHASELDTRFVKSPGLEEYPTANALYLKDDLTYSVASDGSTRFFEHDAIKMLNHNGVSTYSTVLRGYDSNTEEIKVVSAKTITPEGKVIKVPESSITTTTAIDSPAYSAYKILSIEFPHCVTSAVVEYELATTRKSGACKYWWQGSFMQNLDPILNTSFTLNVPRHTKFVSHMSKGVSGPVKSESADVDTYVWRSDKDGSLTPEPSMPPYINYLKSVEVTNCPSWEELATWYGQEWDKAIAHTEKFGLKTTAITSSSKPKRQRIEDVLDWFAKRYEIEPSLPVSYNLNTPDTLFECKAISSNDAAMLLAALLKQCGIDCYPVLATTFCDDGKLQNRTATLDKIDHVILRLTGDDGRDWWINPTAGAVLSTCPPSSYQQKDVIYLASQGQQPGIVRLQSSKAEDYMRDIRLDILVEDRSADIALNLTLDGDTAKSWRSLLLRSADMPSNERDTLFTYLSQEVNKEFAVPTVPYSYYFPENTNTNEPFAMNSTVISAGLSSGTQDNEYSMPVAIFGGDRLISLLTNQTKRTKPIDLEHPFIDEIRVHVELPKDAKITATPKDNQVTTSCGSFCTFTRHTDREAWLYCRLVVNKAWFEVKEMKELMPLVKAQSDCFKTLLKYSMPPKAKEADQDKAEKNKPTDKTAEPAKEATPDNIELPGDLP